jgi:hypothetical protein
LLLSTELQHFASLLDGWHPCCKAHVSYAICIRKHEQEPAVNPGFGHQHFIHSTLAKIQRVRRIIQQVGPECELELDGGIDETTAPLGVAAGANVLVAGTSIFGASQGIETAMRRLREATK